jgi:serine phosphatase RsbU (regulator of sigma subunit)
MSQNSANGQESKRARRLERLIAANHSLAELESLEALLPRLIELARDVTAAEASSLLLYDPRRNVLEFASVEDEVVGRNADAILKASLALNMGEGIAGWVAQNRRSIIVRDVQRDPRFCREVDRQTGFVTRTLLSVPLVHHDELLGVINVLNAKDKPCFDAEDQELMQCFSALAAVALVRSRLLANRLAQERLQVKLQAAARIQSLFWPKLPEPVAGSHVWGVSLPAASVGGDVYDVIPLPDGSWLLYVADVSDKGLPAALLMVAVWSQIRSAATTHGRVSDLLEAANDAMCDLLGDEGFFVTIALGRYWPAEGRLQFSLAGHGAPLQVGDGRTDNLPTARATPLGVLPGTRYTQSEITVPPGESVLFLSDGVIDAENPQGIRFGRSGIVDHLQDASGPPRGRGLVAAVGAWRGPAEISDDLTVLEIWRDRPLP